MHGPAQLSPFVVFFALISLLLALFLVSPGFSQTPGLTDQVWPQQGNWSPKDCGLVTRISPNLMNTNCLQSMANLYMDSDYSLSRRNGYSTYNLTPCTGSQPIRGLWPFFATDGTKYLIAYSTGTMFYSSGDGTCNAITGLQNLSTSAEMECVQALGYLNCTNGTDTPFRTNVTSTQTLSTAPLGTHIGTYRNRIVIGGVSGNYTRLYLSGELDPTDWTLNLFPSLSTSPVQIDISGANDGQKINCLMGQFQNQFYIGRDYDLFALSGYDNRDFTLRKVSEQIGCIEPKSVQEVNNQLIWVSKRGIESLSGTQITPISYPIDPTIRQIIAAAGNTRSQTVTTQADWQAGNLTASGPGAPISATLSPSDITVSSWSITESTAQFVSGTFVHVSTIPNQGKITLIQDVAAFTNAGGESGDITTNWQSNNFSNVSDSTMFGSKAFQQGGASNTCPKTMTFKVKTSSGGVIYSSSVSVSDGMGVQSLNIDVSQNQVSMLVIDVFGVGPPLGIVPEALSVPFLTGNSIHLKYRNANAAGNCNPSWDMDESQIISSGTYTTIRYDTSFSTPTFGPIDVTVSSGAAVSASSPTAANITIQTQVSATFGGTLDAQVSDTNGQKIASAQKEFIVAVASFSVNSTTNTPPSLSSLDMTAETTGYYITECIHVSTPAAWGNLTVDGVNNGGSFTFWESTGATCGAAIASTATWTTQIANSIITVTTNTAYTATRVLFTIDSGTQTPTLNDITWNWSSGSNRPPAASMEYLDRYYLFYTTNTVGSPHNDHALVYDYNQKWTLLDDINAYSATKYLNQPYIGDSNATGTIYQFDTGQSDNGSAFNIQFQTSDLDMGEPNLRKSFERAYLSLSAPANPSQAISLNCNYAIDGSTTTYAFPSVALSESPEDSGYFIAKLPFPNNQVSNGHWVNLNCSYSGTDGPVKIYGLKIVWAPLSWE